MNSVMTVGDELPSLVGVTVTVMGEVLTEGDGEVDDEDEIVELLVDETDVDD